MTTIRVKLRTSPYDVVIGERLLVRAGEHIARIAEPTRVLVVTNATVSRLWGDVLSRSLKRLGAPVSIFRIPDGERYKSLGSVEKLLREFVAAGADRKSLVVAFGGGVVGDLAGFAASIYMRGIPVVQIPTTVLAQVDAAIGGKTGANLPAGKNLVGTFHQPALVIVDPDVTATLPERDYRAGLYEAVKCGVIRDATLFRRFEQQAEEVLESDPELLHDIITRSVRVKAEVVAADERESDLRRILNFGHTIGHALEAEAGYRGLQHGEAVAWGMIAATEIGANSGVTAQRDAERIVATVSGLGRLPRVKANATRIMRRFSVDKKSVSGVPHLVLATRIGAAKVFNNIDPRIVRAAIANLNGGST